MCIHIYIYIYIYICICVCVRILYSVTILHGFSHRSTTTLVSSCIRFAPSWNDQTQGTAPSCILMGAVSKSPFQADSDVPSQIPSFEGQRVIFLLDFIVPTLLCQHQGVVHRTWKEHRIHIDLMRPNESVQSPKGKSEIYQSSPSGSSSNLSGLVCHVLPPPFNNLGESIWGSLTFHLLGPTWHWHRRHLATPEPPNVDQVVEILQVAAGDRIAGAVWESHGLGMGQLPPSSRLGLFLVDLGPT